MNWTLLRYANVWCWFTLSAAFRLLPEHQFSSRHLVRPIRAWSRFLHWLATNRRHLCQLPLFLSINRVRFNNGTSHILRSLGYRVEHGDAFHIWLCGLIPSREDWLRQCRLVRSVPYAHIKWASDQFALWDADHSSQIRRGDSFNVTVLGVQFHLVL